MEIPYANVSDRNADPDLCAGWLQQRPQGDEADAAAETSAAAAAPADGARSSLAAIRARPDREIDGVVRSNIRANAIEASQNVLGDEDRMDIVSKLSDPEPVVRFAACMACGLRLSEAHQSCSIWFTIPIWMCRSARATHCIASAIRATATI